MYSKQRFQWLMLAPVILLLIGLTIFPFVYTVSNSFTDYYYLAEDSRQYVGLDNYLRLLQDELFLQSIWNTVKFMLLAVSIETILGLGIALLVDSVRRGLKVLRVSVLIPSLLPPVTVALIWQIMLSNHNGIINHLLAGFGAGPFNFLLDVNLAFGAIVFIDIWQWTPFAFLLIYAGLQAVPAFAIRGSQSRRGGQMAYVHSYYAAEYCADLAAGRPASHDRYVQAVR